MATQGHEGQALTEDDMREVLRELVDTRTKWYELGLELGLKYKDLEMIKKYYPDDLDRIREVAVCWLRSSDSPTWKDLADALGSRLVGAKYEAGCLRRKYCTTGVQGPDEPVPKRGEKPNVWNLISFPGKTGKFNILQQISEDYLTFGVFLLLDETGSKVSAIQHKYCGNNDNINLEIVRQWFEGEGQQPCSWDTLTSVLKQIGLNWLAEEIDDGLNYIVSPYLHAHRSSLHDSQDLLKEEHLKC